MEHQHEEISEATMVSPSTSSSTSLSTTGATNHGSQHHAYSILTIHDEPLPPPPPPMTFMSFVRSRMAFRPPVPHDPRLFSARQKRWILVCLAFGGSLNGFCSTIYVCDGWWERNNEELMHLWSIVSRHSRNHYWIWCIRYWSDTYDILVHVIWWHWRKLTQN